MQHARPQYWAVQSLLEPRERAGRMAAFTVPLLTDEQRADIAALLPGLSLDPA